MAQETHRVPETLRHLLVPIEQLQPYPGNARTHADVEIRGSLEVNGQYRPVVARTGTNHVLAGNGTLAAAQALGWTHLAATFVDVDDQHARRIVLVDNRTNDLAGYQDRLLADLLRAQSPDLYGTGFDQAAVDEILASAAAAELGAAGGPGEGLTDPDETPEPPAEPVTKPGDVWLLGPHRLLCGDATDADQVERALAGAAPGIVYTDPPYGINIVSDVGKVGATIGYPFGGAKNGPQGSPRSVRTTAYRPVAGDDTTDTAARAFRLIHAAHPAARHVWWGGNHYAGSAGLPDGSCWLVWDKEVNGNFADAELAWTNHPGAVRLFRHMWNGMLRASERGKRSHPNQKPVALAEWSFRTVDPRREVAVVLDMFAGSGPTLIAAHRTERTAVLMELEPPYCDVICQRWQDHTGTLPVLEATGEAVRFGGG